MELESTSGLGSFRLNRLLLAAPAELDLRRFFFLDSLRTKGKGKKGRQNRRKVQSQPTAI